LPLFRKLYNRLFLSKKAFNGPLFNLLGFTPVNISIYRQAFIHSSASKGTKENNERLEYLGDAILDAVVSDILFKKYPKKTEGFLTQTRSKIVSRKMLGKIAKQMGIQELLKHSKLKIKDSPSVLGNALEALIGAIYLDQGYDKATSFISKKIISPYIDFNTLINEELNYKSKLLEWSQKNGKEISLDIVDERNYKAYRVFTAVAIIEKEELGRGKGRNKKNAENEAARMAYGVISGNKPKGPNT